MSTAMFDGGASYVDDIEASTAGIAPLMRSPELLRERVVHWYGIVSSRGDVDPDRIAAIGYCFGDQCVLELARSGADA